MKKPFCVVVPAIKKSAIIPDQLVKKLNGITLIQRAINTSKEMANSKDCYVVTDSQEISLICQRNKINYYLKPELRIDNLDIINELKFFINKRALEYEYVILYRANTPLIQSEDILTAFKLFKKDKHSDILITLKEEKHRVWKGYGDNINNLIFNESKEHLYLEIKSFLIVKSSYILSNRSLPTIYPYVLNENAIEIESYQHWWICERLLRRKRILFVVTGNNELGMGHIYRALTVAHEIDHHEIIFLCTKDSELAAKSIAEKDYKTLVQKKKLVQEVLDIKPDLVINDILNTEEQYILELKENHIKVVNFEDLGTGSSHSDLTINELYDHPINTSNNICWGNSFLFLRDEFLDAGVNTFKEKIEEVLITFGGSDPNNYMLRVLKLILGVCKKHNIIIQVVSGAGYIHKEELENFIENSDYKDNIHFTYATGIISKIMEQCQIAISSNGRTVYELAHMNIISIILSHHDREATHDFAKEEHGFINLGVYKDKETDEKIKISFEKLVTDNEYRKSLFDKANQFNFLENKKKVIKMIMKLIDKK